MCCLVRWYSCWLTWCISPWGPCAPPCSRWSFSAPRGRSFHPSTPSIRSLCIKETNLQVLGLHPVDVMAPHALSHHLDRCQSHNYDIPKQDLQRRRPGSWRRQRWRREAGCRRGASTSSRSQSPDHDFCCHPFFEVWSFFTCIPFLELFMNLPRLPFK